MISYAGIGSREAPDWILSYMRAIARWLGLKGYNLRSGHAPGSDFVFELGCDEVNGSKEIFLPWIGFNGSDSTLIVNKELAFKLAEKYHKFWNSLRHPTKLLMARNGHQVLGKELNDPVKFVVCWTKNGSGEGGTGQAIRIALDYNIPIFDMGIYDNIVDLKKGFKEFCTIYNI